MKEILRLLSKAIEQNTINTYQEQGSAAADVVFHILEDVEKRIDVLDRETEKKAVQPTPAALVKDPYVRTKLLQQVCTVCEFGAIDSDDQFYCDLGKAPSKCSTCVEALQNILKILHIPPCHFS